MPTDPTKAVIPPTRNGRVRIVSEIKPHAILSVIPVAAPRLRKIPAAPSPSPASTPELTPQALSDPAANARKAPTTAARTRSCGGDSGTAARAADLGAVDPTAALTVASETSANDALAT